jgi:hypothetical protein
MLLFGLAAFAAFAVEPLALGVPLVWLFFKAAVYQEENAPVLKRVVGLISVVVLLYAIVN